MEAKISNFELGKNIGAEASKLTIIGSYSFMGKHIDGPNIETVVDGSKMLHVGMGPEYVLGAVLAFIEKQNK